MQSKMRHLEKEVAQSKMERYIRTC